MARPQPTVFRNPQKLADWGYNSQVIEAQADSCETFDARAPGILPKASAARAGIEQHAQALEPKAQQAHAAGLKAYAWFQCIGLPKAVVAKFKDEFCDELGRIDLERPGTQNILRTQIAELFERCPSLDGLVVRTGEIYLHDSPFHAASADEHERKIQSSTAIIHGPASHIALLKILRDEVCVQRDKLVFYRNWDFGNNFHVNPKYYLKVTGAIKPHPNLIFSIKHQADDFLRMRPFNPTLGLGRHRQIVEVQGQREAYGKGAHPYYVGDGGIHGWEEYATLMKPGQPRGLRDLENNKNFAGGWTWSRGGGWEGPYLTKELWCALNACVLAKYAENPKRTEAEIFNEFATRQLGLQGEDVAKFRASDLLSAAAILRGQCSLIQPVDLWRARDDFMAAPDLKMFSTTHLMIAALAEKAEAVTLWRKIETLARQIHFADPATQDFVETPCAYGRIKYSIFEQGWTVLLYGQMGDKTKPYDREKISAASSRYDDLWQEWRALQAAHPACATLSKDVAFGKGNNSSKAFASQRPAACNTRVISLMVRQRMATPWKFWRGQILTGLQKHLAAQTISKFAAGLKSFTAQTGAALPGLACLTTVLDFKPSVRAVNLISRAYFVDCTRLCTRLLKRRRCQSAEGSDNFEASNFNRATECRASPRFWRYRSGFTFLPRGPKH